MNIKINAFDNATCRDFVHIPLIYKHCRLTTKVTKGLEGFMSPLNKIWNFMRRDIQERRRI